MPMIGRLTSTMRAASLSEVNTEELKQSPLAGVHRELGARMVPFAGWEMPVQYKSILVEHAAVRERAGIFDISHMGQFVARGAGVVEWLDGLLTNRVAKLDPGRGQYTIMLNEQGGVIDDLIIYRTGEEEILLVVNAARLEEDFEWLSAHLAGGIELENDSAGYARMAVQGADAPAAFAKIAPGYELPKRNGVARFDDLRGGTVVCRTGYTGEDGFELLCPVGEGEGWFRDFVAAGVEPCGLGARDTLRLEVCYPLNGSDLLRDRTPLEAGLGFFVDLEKGPFIGRDVLLAQKRDGLPGRLAAIRCDAKGAPPRAGYPVLDAAGREIGALSSGVLSPTLGIGIGMAYLPLDSAKAGTEVAIDIRGRKIPARVVKKPFYKPEPKAS
jgi:aminomethyltransferase